MNHSTLTWTSMRRAATHPMTSLLAREVASMVTTIVTALVVERLKTHTTRMRDREDCTC
jgi:hypothetical protein